MRRIFATLVAVAATFASTSFSVRSLAAPPSEAEGAFQGQGTVSATLWVVNRDADNLTVFDGATGAVGTHVCGRRRRARHRHLRDGRESVT